MAEGGPFGDARGGWPRPRSAPDAAALAVPVTLPTKRAAEALAARGVATAGDLLELVPRRYRNYAEGLATLAEVQPGAEATVRCRVESIRLRPTRRPGLVIVEARVADETGTATAVWFNQRYLLRALPAGSLRADARSTRAWAARPSSSPCASTSCSATTGRRSTRPASCRSTTPPRRSRAAPCTS